MRDIIKVRLIFELQVQYILYRYWILFAEFCGYFWNQCFIHFRVLFEVFYFGSKERFEKLKMDGFREMWELRSLSKVLLIIHLCCFDRHRLVYFFLAIYSCHQDMHRKSQQN
ncbi:unnamed protein product [Paramecium octaurelia]|uniref:Uncharacterized protein n=1 Tax=Paramecium octaurelia TaxID=43137 RepID=A0A8S1SAC0_PAROT|nr:unnamed protein product [Paramecium octaurelia]